jgi:hypothetical protein
MSQYKKKIKKNLLKLKKKIEKEKTLLVKHSKGKSEYKKLLKKTTINRQCNTKS